MESLIARQQKHSGENPHLCPHCDYKTNYSNDLKKHIRTHTGEKPHLCPHCDYRTNQSSTLKTHIRAHTGEKPQLCPHCDYRTNQSSNLKTHIRTHTGEKPQLCPHCDYRTNQSSHLKRHIRSHTGEKPQLCPHCDYRTNESSNLKTHIRTHTGEKPQLCPHCDYRTNQSSNLKRHIRSHTSEKPQLCPHCDYRTNNSSNLKIHIRTHTGEKPHLCPHCDYRTNQSSTLKTHIRAHTGEKPQLCPNCDYRTNYSSTLKRHIRTHTGEKPHFCPHCDYRTNNSSNLKIHIRTHTGEKPHLCPHCDYRTNQSSTLKTHIRAHTGEKPQLCPYCEYRANQSSTLITHIRTHTGEKPQLCPHCDYRTNQSSNLKIHIRTHTGREWGADATTLKSTYTSLIRPILEYGYQIYATASETNLKSLERIQLSAARIITGLRNTCPNDIVLYEADIMPLKDRRSYNLPKYINKIKKYLKQLSLEIINNIPKNAITIYTDGSRDELGHTGSGCLIKTTNGIEKMNRRNPDFCSVFRSELIAIYEALKSIRNTNYQDIWILTDSRSAIQHLSHTGELRDKVGRNIIGYLQKLSKTLKIHLQWIPSHVGIEGNEAADVLAKKGTKEPLPQKNKLTFKEIETLAKTKINKNWRIPPKHSLYSGVNPGGALNIRNRQHQTTLTRFRTCHLKPLKIENNNKIYPTCPKCSLAPAAPEHILACIRCTKQDLWERPLLIIKQLEEHELMDFV
ncbi:hypothetical protein LAZ67_8004009 [Cordylochernes scorpioides]|uniref:Uncharacterized protein n=1 Tax=Cordylochernes scorpioides TaxID=51811 RepID=A0ABY6KX38_9ARAC|nr:hypothetical protein LAZ67_8004009 [Cordylochernes scorpioides]